MVADMAANIEMHMVAGMEVEKVVYKVADMVYKARNVLA